MILAQALTSGMNPAMLAGAAAAAALGGAMAYLIVQSMHAETALRGVYNAIGRATHGMPVLGNLFGASLSGRSFMTAGLILAVMITPIITSISREVLRTVPINDRNGHAQRLGGDEIGRTQF